MNSYKDKNSSQADALGNIYRAAYYMAKGDTVLARNLVGKTRNVSRILSNKAKKIIDCKSEHSGKVVAEYLLDLYLDFK